MNMSRGNQQCRTALCLQPPPELKEDAVFRVDSVSDYKREAKPQRLPTLREDPSGCESKPFLAAAM